MQASATGKKRQVKKKETKNPTCFSLAPPPSVPGRTSVIMAEARTAAPFAHPSADLYALAPPSPSAL